MRHKLIGTLFFAALFGCVSSKDQEVLQKEYPIESTLELGSSVLGVSVVADSLDVPWDIAWGNDGSIWMTELKGTVSRLDLGTGEKHELLKIDDVWHKRTAGLLGMALHPDMERHPFVFVNYTAREGKDSTIVSKLVRYTYKANTLTKAKTLLQIEGNMGHNGARVAFTKDGKLLWATGDAVKDGYAQDTTVLNGKILRINIDGSVPADNPIKGSYVWAWGFRNMQGLAVASDGQVYTSEHGDATEDEINLIKPLHNYGWPEIEGFHDKNEENLIAAKYQRTEPLKSWTPTIAPAGIAMYESEAIPEWKNAILLGTLKGKSLRVLKLNADGTAITSEEIFWENEYGRLRDICVSPSGDIYVATSNRDWNPSPGFPKENDDRILLIRKVKESEIPPQLLASNAKGGEAVTQELTGATLYSQYCSSCHKDDGAGVAGTFPPLQGAEQVTGDKAVLMNIVLNGLSGPIVVKGNKYDQAMPAFSFLKDDELASILTYVRGSWGNNASAVSIDEVKSFRKK
ncbi:PQQ-dependent sugar dehydrogenase [Pontibacter korlensis]|uniref:Quinoprotein glucose dehydrogenase n=1 Tax=Pontibacter korlensis TaxID=400092 RepID=A0A0E3UZI0_9BACT|nr:PQQ-dependent sugar dehydrogenase [Pontibacter korlensis]AKD05371.1 quinoprotein glucose dehydrogenase [Pontibacter korlensis]